MSETLGQRKIAVLDRRKERGEAVKHTITHALTAVVIVTLLLAAITATRYITERGDRAAVVRQTINTNQGESN